MSYIFVKFSTKLRIKENKDSSFGLFLDTWLPRYLCMCARMCVCTLYSHFCAPVWVTVGCLVAHGNSCYWGFFPY